MRLAALVAAVFALAAFAPAQSRAEPPDLSDVAVGETIKLCEECPEFVRVPDAPEELRPIRFVAKYELTWNNYLAAVDAGACAVPDPTIWYKAERDPDFITPNLDLFRIEWPITILQPSSVECFVGWLSEETGLSLAVPTHDEWLWFASAGRSDTKYPWGRDPDAGEEMLDGKINDDVIVSPTTIAGRETSYSRYVVPHLHGFKVGQGRPNPWGIHDLLGNVSEVTSTMIPPEKEGPCSRQEEIFSCPRLATGGTSWGDRLWSERGLRYPRRAMIINDKYSTRLGLRLIALGVDDE